MKGISTRQSWGTAYGRARDMSLRDGHVSEVVRVSRLDLYGDRVQEREEDRVSSRSDGRRVLSHEVLRRGSAGRRALRSSSFGLL